MRNKTSKLPQNKALNIGVVMHRIARIILGILIFPLSIILGAYTITIAPICWIISGNNSINYLREKFTDKYMQYVLYGA